MVAARPNDRTDVMKDCVTFRVEPRFKGRGVPYPPFYCPSAVAPSMFGSRLLPKRLPAREGSILVVAWTLQGVQSLLCTGACLPDAQAPCRLSMMMILLSRPQHQLFFRISLLIPYSYHQRLTSLLKIKNCSYFN